ncbi:RDD family protein [Streptomyces sp. NRRL B-24484]|uniref:RDD family protein n=1 Tax=Streptomyces sp. NRRL B-24484 TaxID=1463833 RepID=UPI0004BEEF3F|nr:RDD family protein [Streptomyces sp. NRRL B-24484]
MTDRPNGGASDTAVGPMPGYYPDPSIPGFVRYWGGTGWVPGTTRPAPAEGEVLEPPRIVSRQTPPLVPPTAAPPTAGRSTAGRSAGDRPAAGPSPVIEAPSAAPGPSADTAPAEPSRAEVPAPATPSLPDWPSPPLSDSDTRTGPVYFDETSAGASFVMAAHAEVELRPRADVEPLRAEQPALRPVPPTVVPPPAAVAVPSARSAPSEVLSPVAPGEQPPAAEESEERIPAARTGGSGWQADPRAQRGLLETGAAPRWVSWGVLPTGAEADAGPADVAHVAAPPSFPAPAPVRAVQTLQEAPFAAATATATVAPEVGAEVQPVVAEPVETESEVAAEEPVPAVTAEAEPVEPVEPVGPVVAAATAAEAPAGTAAPVAGAEPAGQPVEQPHTASEPDGSGERMPREAPGAAHRAAAARPATARPAAVRAQAVTPVEGRAAEQAASRAADRPVPDRRSTRQAPAGQAAARPTAAGRATEQRTAEQRPATSARKAATRPATKPAAKQATKAAKSGPKPEPVQSAGLARRLAARIVDSLVVLVVAAAAGVPLGTEAAAHLREKLDQARAASALAGHEVRVWLVDGVVLGKVGVLIGVLVVFGVLYEVLPTTRTGQTFGKRLVRIRVVDARGAGTGRRTPPSFSRSLVRWAVRQLAVLMPVGLLWPLFDRRARRGWQDRAAATRVVKG